MAGDAGPACALPRAIVAAIRNATGNDSRSRSLLRSSRRSTTVLCGPDPEQLRDMLALLRARA